MNGEYLLCLFVFLFFVPAGEGWRERGRGREGSWGENSIYSSNVRAIFTEVGDGANCRKGARFVGLASANVSYQDLC